jgi:cytidylate kinase
LAPEHTSKGEQIVIAIDGPAASGKSTVALEIARRLGLELVDSGSMYRAVTLVARESGVDPGDRKALQGLARAVRFEFRCELPDNGPPRVYLGGREITSEIRSAGVGEAVSVVSEFEEVRREMVELQRSLAGGSDAVVEGRDIGTAVFPDADLKVFLEASVYERVRRRYLESEEKGFEVSMPQVEKEIEMRDRIDSSREVSPLRMAPDAVPIDTTEKSIEQVVTEIIEICEELGLVRT